MLPKPLFVIALLCLLPAAIFAGDPPVDLSRADADGPHVFYRGKNIVIKTIERADTARLVQVQFFTKRNGIALTCRLPESGDQFTFPLKDKIRTEKDVYALPERMLVISDIEGNFEAFKQLLRGGNVVDAGFKWIFGDGHLVLLGDFFDRGLNVTECLWLIYKLEAEAEAAGGKVHFILGNHEVMNLSGDFDYVRNKYIENAQLIGEDYSLWYDDHSELGRWLRSKNAVERIGDFVFCHGGISPLLAGTDLQLYEINELVHQFVGKKDTEINDSLARIVFDGHEGIFWYRGAAKAKMSSPEVDAALKFADAKRMVIGHTLVPEVMSLYDGRVICVDLFHDENLREGRLTTLYVERGHPYSLDTLGDKSTILAIQQPHRK